MRFRSALVAVLATAAAVACGEDPREQEEVTVPGEGPTYLGDSAAAGAAPPMMTTPSGAPAAGDSLVRRDSVPPR